jgi:hypothetical protein
MDKMDRADKMGFARRLLGSAGTAGLAVLMVGVVAFGATAIRPLTAGQAPESPPASDKPTAQAVDVMEGDGKGEHPYQARKHKPEATHKPADQPKETPKDEPKAEPTSAPKPVEQTKAKPTAKPQPKETPKPAPTTLSLEAWVKDPAYGKVKLAWSKFAADGFAYYKVVRSTDEAVQWPAGGNDSLIAAISDPYAPYFADKAPCGQNLFYRVFAVNAAHAVLSASNAVHVSFECVAEPTPPPAPTAMGFSVQQVDGKVVLSWEKCGGEGFVYYKVVRSATNATPTYPLNAGDELLAAIGDANQTAFVDEHVEAGQTWTYRVLSFGQNSHGKFVLGATAPMTITVE